PQRIRAGKDMLLWVPEAGRQNARCSGKAMKLGAHPPVPRLCLNIALVFPLPACVGTPFLWGNAKKMRLRMTQTQVKAVVGRPNKIEIKDDTQRWVWSYATPSKTIRSVAFELRDGVVTAIPYTGPID